MARVEKKTKISGLPPQLQLEAADSVTGSFPTLARTAIVDNRTGIYKTGFNDQNTVLFGVGYSSASHVPSMSYKLPGQSLTPFRDSQQYGADGKSSGGVFYTTGTNIEGLAGPVWSKNKIEIPLNVSTQSKISIRRDVLNTSYQVGYFNFAAGTWEGIGQGLDPKQFTNSISAIDDMAHSTHSIAAFGPSMLLPRDSRAHVQALGEPIQTYGFPFAWKYHATASQLYHMTGAIDRPFLVEKFVVMVSASFSGSVSSFSESVTRQASIETHTNLFTMAANTFFIMNQRENQEVNKPFYYNTIPVYATTPTSSQISKNGSLTHITTTRDLIGYANILSYASSMTEYSASANTATNPDSFAGLSVMSDLETREFLIPTAVSGVAGVFWNPRNLVVSGTCAMPNESTVGTSDHCYLISSARVVSVTYTGNNGIDQFNSAFTAVTKDFRGGGRNGFGVDRFDNRSLMPAPTTGQVLGENSYWDNGSVFLQKDFKKTNPYMLYPNDKLIVGWQLPFLWSVIVGSVSSSNTMDVTFYPGEAKLVLYGSYLSEEQAVNDTLNQFLTTNSVHEAM